MLATDLEEARLCYLRAVYLAAPPARRPARLPAPPGLPGGSPGSGGKVGNLLTCLMLLGICKFFSSILWRRFISKDGSAHVPSGAKQLLNIFQAEESANY